jgi:hypothetical protein
MFEHCDERSTELLLDQLLEKGIIVSGCLVWQSGNAQQSGGSETTSQAFEDQGDS